MNLFCWLGWHSWEPTPRVMEYVKHTGVDFLFWSTGVQKGEQYCQKCPATRTVCRAGMVGIGGSSGPWRACSEARAEVIDRLPVM